MSTVKVIYVEQSAGKIDDIRLNDLIAKGIVAAFCSSDKWIEVNSEQASDVDAYHQNLKERGREQKAAEIQRNS